MLNSNFYFFQFSGMLKKKVFLTAVTELHTSPDVLEINYAARIFCSITAQPWGHEDFLPLPTSCTPQLDSIPTLPAPSISLRLKLSKST